jgi:hydroxypyruvate reductase
MNKTHLLSIFKKALEAVDPYKAVLSAFELTNGEVTLRNKLSHSYNKNLNGFNWRLRETGNIYLVGCGKAVCPMSDAVEDICSQYISSGIVVTKYGHRKPSRLSKIEVLEASHPVPDNNGLIGANEVRGILKNAGKDDLVIALISGGGSALWTLPVDGISLDDLIQTNQLLLESGASIHEINSIRKNLSGLQGGRAAVLAHPSTVVVFIISDVIGDDLDTIASGPFYPDSSTFETASRVIRKYGLDKEIPRAVSSCIAGGIDGKYKETPKKNDPCFDNIYHVLVGTNLIAQEAAREHALKLGFDCVLVEQPVQGEAKDAARNFCQKIKAIYSTRESLKPLCIISGGETTVTLKRPYGKGGRNQEFALAAAGLIQGESISILSCGTDGSDGPTDATGAMVDGEFMRTCAEMGLNAENYLANHDSYSLFEKTGNLIKTGPTLTNVMDIQIALVGGGK